MRTKQQVCDCKLITCPDCSPLYRRKQNGALATVEGIEKMRKDGKSWAEIAARYGYSSAGTAANSWHSRKGRLGYPTRNRYRERRLARLAKRIHSTS